jgi:murein DD-endopeptidase MepM/ murein hydrolase activator NlpD
VAGGLGGSAQQVYGYFRERGLSPAQAAGVTGNTQQESGNNPNSPGGGLIQGQGGRTSSGSLAEQLAGVWRELNGPERGTLNALRGAHDPQQAARIFSERFERPGIPMLGNRERYAQEALKSYGGGSGAGGAPGAAQAGSVAPGGTQAGSTPAQIEDLMMLMSSLAPQQGSSTSVEGVALPKPGAEPTAGPRVPRALESAQAPAASPAALLALISKIGEDGSTGSAPSAGGTSSGMSAAGSQVVPGGYVNPLPGFKLGRTDMGVDANAAPGTPIRALGNAKVLGVAPNWYQGQPYVSYELIDGPRGRSAPNKEDGQVIYVAEQITPHVKAGDYVKAGQPIGVYAPTGTGIETGLGTRGWQTKAQASGNTGDASHGNAPAGIEARKLLETLGAR